MADASSTGRHHSRRTRPHTRHATPTMIGSTIGPDTNVIAASTAVRPGGAVRDHPVEHRLVEVPQVVLLPDGVEHTEEHGEARDDEHQAGQHRPEHRARAEGREGLRREGSGRRDIEPTLPAPRVRASAGTPRRPLG